MHTQPRQVQSAQEIRSFKTIDIACFTKQTLSAHYAYAQAGPSKRSSYMFGTGGSSWNVKCLLFEASQWANGAKMTSYRRRSQLSCAIRSQKWPCK